MNKNGRRILCAVLTWFMLLALLAGCEPPSGYTGSREDLLTLVYYNVIGTGVDSRGIQPTGSFSERIDVIGQDSYGRTLFGYWCMQSGFYFDQELRAMCICQKSDKENVYYYEDDCFFLYTDYDKIPQEKIDELKERNDWEQPYNDRAMTQADVLKSYRLVFHNASALDKPMYEKKSVYYTAAMNAVNPPKQCLINDCLLTQDTNGNVLVVLQAIHPDYRELRSSLTVSDSDAASHSYLTVEPGLSLTKNYLVFVNKYGGVRDRVEVTPEQLYDYREIVKDFKAQNGWAK